jgi:MoaA/NifB/PqqE/SkfB family radical SAM enzyme
MMLRRQGVTPLRFYDKELSPGSWRGLPISGESVDNTENAVLAMTVTRQPEVIAECERLGIKYTLPHSFCPHYPTIDVCDICGLHCPACPRLKGCSWMKAAMFEQILAKMVKEIPYLYMVDLYCWGDPLLNPQIPEIARICNDLGVASGISTPLTAIRTLRALCKEQPTQIRVAMSGFGENYEHDGVDWPIFQRNCRILSECKGETLVEMYWHMSKKNIGDWPYIRDWCFELGFRPRPVLSTVFPDYAIAKMEGRWVNGRTEELAKEMIVSTEDLVAASQAENSKRCLQRDAYPYVSPNGDALACCAYAVPEVLGKYLGMRLEDIAPLRNGGTTCARCKMYGMGRYFNIDRYDSMLGKMLEGATK